MTAEAVQILHRRIMELDQKPRPDEPDRDLHHFVWVMQSYFDSSMGLPGCTVITPVDSDALIDSCRLISRISIEDRPLVAGPLSQGRQHWIATGRHVLSEGNVPTPTKARFIGPRSSVGRQLSTPNPSGIGLYTSTPTHSGTSMWRMYLDLFPSEMTPWPWFVWQLESRGQAIAEISSAADWVRFVEAYSLRTDRLVSPDWPQVSEDFAGIHVTARAVAAAQGFSFKTRSGLTAPAFWDVEQTLWLRWGFASASLVEGPQQA